MKALIVGGGSIGFRHLRNLTQLGVVAQALVEPDVGRRADLCSQLAIAGFGTLEEGLEWEPDIVVISTPSHLHVGQAIEAARRGYPLFVEKPLSHSKERLCDLVKEVDSRKLISLVGCNMRFHPGPAKIKQLLESGVIGRVLFARIHTGSYLPAWRPWQDYRQSYSANASMGGGCILDCIHEIDLARWYLGNVSQVFCVAEHLSSLEIDVEDIAVLICRHLSGALSEIHLDYVQRSYERGCQIVGERGSILWNYNERVVKWFDAESDCWAVCSQPDDWQLNQMYLDEMEHFLDCVKSERQTTLPIVDAVEVMRIALGAKVSAGCGNFISTDSVFLC